MDKPRFSPLPTRHLASKEIPPLTNSVGHALNGEALPPLGHISSNPYSNISERAPRRAKRDWIDSSPSFTHTTLSVVEPSPPFTSADVPSAPKHIKRTHEDSSLSSSTLGYVPKEPLSPLDLPLLRPFSPTAPTPTYKGSGTLPQFPKDTMASVEHLPGIPSPSTLPTIPPSPPPLLLSIPAQTDNEHTHTNLSCVDTAHIQHGDDKSQSHLCPQMPSVSGVLSLEQEVNLPNQDIAPPGLSLPYTQFPLKEINGSPSQIEEPLPVENSDHLLDSIGEPI